VGSSRQIFLTPFSGAKASRAVLQTPGQTVMSRFSAIRSQTPRSNDRRRRLCASTILAGMAVLACASAAQALPSGGQVVAGGAEIGQGQGGLNIVQSTQNAAINWQSFNIDHGESVAFVQPNSQSVALNRVVGAEASSIFGNLTANGKVFLVNPNGILFGAGAQVNVGGLVASTLNIGDDDFMAGRYIFSGNSRSSVSNQGSISADGGYVALLGAKVSNDGVISARMGSVALAAGEALTLDVAGDGLLSVAVDKGAVDALVANGGLIRAEGGQVMLTARAAGQLLHTVVNNSGVIEARTLQNRNGSISLMGDADSGVVNVLGTLDASAPNGGNGGFIETSAATVNVDNASMITTTAPSGVTGNWLIDPVDFVIGTTLVPGNIDGTTLSTRLVTTSVTISTAGTTAVVTPANLPITPAAAGTGKITVNGVIDWTAPANAPTTLTLNAAGDVVINAAISATHGSLVVCCAADVHVNGAITTVNGSVLFSAGRDLIVPGAISVTDGNLTLCAGRDLTVAGAITAVRASATAGEDLSSLGVRQGVFFVAGNGGTGLGTLTLPAAPKIAVTGGGGLGSEAVLVEYVPASYTAPHDYSTNFTLVTATLSQKMLVFPTVIKVYDGSTATTLVSLLGTPTNVALAGAGTATFDSAAVGSNIGITYTGYSLTGSNAAAFVLGSNCCTNTFRSKGNIIAAVVITPPAPTPTPTPTPAPTPTPTPTPVPAPVPIPIPTPPPVVAPVPTPLVVATPIVAPVATPQAFLYPALAFASSPGFSLAVQEGGVRMPSPTIIETAPYQPPAPQPVVVAPTPPPPVYAPPVRPRKQDRY
jgi:filamentous hemagglutinin family protein